MRQWAKKLIDQLEMDWSSHPHGTSEKRFEISEELATILFFIDTYNKNLFEVENHPIRRTRESLDEFAKGLVDHDREKVEKNLFRLRQFISSYRLDEYSYIQKTFEDFKNIIWDFADQLGDEIHMERAQELELRQHLDQLREAVEANSIQMLRSKSREFIDTYVEAQTKKEERRSQRVENIQKNLHTVKKKLMEANQSARMDHLTGAHNRKSFDEQLRRYYSLSKISEHPVSLIVLDIDHFKKVNDTYGHPGGDYVLRELGSLVQSKLVRSNDYFARYGGEEFVLILQATPIKTATDVAERIRQTIEAHPFQFNEQKFKVTISIGVAEFKENDTWENIYNRADKALYSSKQAGRNRVTVAE